MYPVVKLVSSLKSLGYWPNGQNNVMFTDEGLREYIMEQVTDMSGDHLRALAMVSSSIRLHEMSIKSNESQSSS